MTDSKLQTMLIRVEKVLRLADGKFILHQFTLRFCLKAVVHAGCSPVI